MFFHYRTPAFILKKEDRGEADRLFTVFTEDFGKLEILGKAIRKISSKLRSGMEIFSLSEIEFIQGKIYKTLTDAILIERFQNLKKSLEKIEISQKIANDLDNFVKKNEEADEKIWRLILESFEKLDNLQLTTQSLQLIYYYFFWNLISILGYRPELYFCLSCQKKLKPEKLYFNPNEGGIICQNCSKKFKNIKEIKPEVVKILRKILEKDWKTLSKLKDIKEYFKSIKVISKNYSSFIFEKK